MNVSIESMSHNGEGVARNAGKVVFIPNAIQGEVVDVDVIEEKKKYSRGILKDIIKKSPHRVEAKCPYYFQCGGCSYQHMDYQQQLIVKQNIIVEILNRIGGIKTKVINLKGMTDPWHYRNKVLWHISESKDGKKMGFYHYRTKYLVEVRDCPVLMPRLNTVSLFVREMLPRIQLEENSSIMVRQSNEKREVIVEFIHCFPDQEVLRKLSQEVDAIYENRNGKPRLLYGQELIKEKAGKCYFYLGPDDFFQVNSEPTEFLIDAVSKYLDLSGYNIVLDAYCGVGMFSLNIKKNASLVVGIDSNMLAIKHARRNAELNGIVNCQFISGPCEKVLPTIKDAFDRIIVDPPRIGLKTEVIQAIIDIFPKIVVYVSCNPGTLARDLKLFLGNGYRVVRVQPIDMFPQTSHIETIVLLQRIEIV